MKHSYEVMYCDLKNRLKKMRTNIKKTSMLYTKSTGQKLTINEINNIVEEVGQQDPVDNGAT